jgi:hypothetical protein
MKALLPTALFMLLPMAVQAHGDAAWIMADPVTNHCCGPQDCTPIAREEVRRNRDGWLLVGTGEFFRDGAPEVYPSVDRRFWRCTGSAGFKPFTRCLFVPLEGT